VPGPQWGSVEWRVGSAEALPVADGSFDRALLSLVLHQLQHPEIAVAEAFRALAGGGRAVVRTIAPEDVVDRVPERFFPAMAAADTERMPPLDAIERWLQDAGLVVTERRRVLRNKKLNLADEERQLRIEVRARYSFVSAAELDAGLRLMRAEVKVNGDGWIDPRPTHIITASKRALREKGIAA
jgi:SAM-dependent methyltransferase